MTGNVTGNTSPATKAQVYSDTMLDLITDGFLPEGLHRDVSDFGDGTTLNIPVLGDVVLRDYVEDTGVQYDPIDTGSVTLTITEYKSAASSVSRKLQQDGYKAADIESRIPGMHLRAIKEAYESDLLAQQGKQTLANPNTINGVDHRWVASSGATNGVISFEDFVYAKLALDKANVSEQNRIAIVDPIVGATFDYLAGAQAFVNNPQWTGIAESGFAKGKRFIRNVEGFDVWVSNRNDTIASEAIMGGPHASAKTATNFVSNIFASFADDQITPFMGAWRQMPKTDGEFKQDFQRDDYVTTARWGFGLQRPDSLVVIHTSKTAYK